MGNPKGKKTISFLVRDDYQYAGKDVKNAVDKLLESMYKMLTREQKMELKSQFKNEMEALKW